MRKVFKLTGVILLALLLLLIGFFGLLSAVEYRPADVTELALEGGGAKTLAVPEMADGGSETLAGSEEAGSVANSGAEILTESEGAESASDDKAETPDADESDAAAGDGVPSQKLTVLSWNIGYSGLGKNADFFMDGGKGVRTQTKEQVQENLEAFASKLEAENPDFVLLQEVDRNSTRSYRINGVDTLSARLPDYQTAFANNFKVLFLPYPVPPIGKVDSGILTLSRYQAERASRIQLPCPFSWPVRLVNLKRCLLAEYIPIEGSDRQLVLVNLHLEAYDSGEGKIEQTKVLANFLEEEYSKGNYVIAGGDFNQSFSGTDTSMYPVQGEGLWECGLLEEEQFPEGWQFLMDNSVPSCRSLDRPYDPEDESFQYYLIDGFIASPNVTALSVETLDLGFVNSDHNPVKLTVQLNP